MTIPVWVYYLIVVAVFWLGFAVAAVLSISKRFAEDAETMGDVGRKNEGEHHHFCGESPDTDREKVLVSALLSEKKARARKAKAASNGTQKIHAKHA